MMEQLANYLGFSVRNTSPDPIIGETILILLVLIFMVAFFIECLWPHLRDAMRFLWAEWRAPCKNIWDKED